MIRGRASLALLLALLLAGAPARGAAQQTAGGQQGSNEGPRVFLDCQNASCDLDFFRTEIGWVNWVRDRAASQVHVLVTSQSTGAGGSQVTLAFIGQQEFQGATQTLTYTSQPTTTSDERRRGMARVLKMGLAPFAARTGIAPNVDVVYRAPAAGAAGAAATPTRDPWNYWVFRSSVSAFTNGEKSSSFLNIYGSVSANRTTANWKMSFSANESYDRQRFDVSETETVKNIQRSYGLNALTVKSAGPHWSYGVTGSVSSSVYLNQRLAVRLTPAVEYDLYPYAEATRRQLRFQYGIGLASFRYRDTTIYFKIRETLPLHTLLVAYTVRQQWGNIGLDTRANSYLNDMRKRQLSVGGNANLRLVKGLSLNFGGNYASIHDQLYLKKGEATEEEVLLRQRQLQTSYRYFGNVGLSYTFGSIFNNVVNPRFGSGFIEF